MQTKLINKITIEQEDKALVTTKEKSLGTNFNQDNWMLVIWLLTVAKPVSVT